MSLIWQNFLQIYGRHKWLLLAGLVVVAIGATVYLWQPSFLAGLPKKLSYQDAYVLVNDKVSQGANIVINVPPFLKKADMQVSFQPTIKGDWVEIDDAKKIAFKPSEPLVIGHYYLAMASSTKGLMTKDFLIAEPPKLTAVLPGPDAEAPLNSKITFMFNRPVVALGQLDKMEEAPSQIEIKPATAGKFKWISTRTLQFIPEKGLIGSANYTVNLKNGLVSLDGLPVPAVENKFSTMNLRYVGDNGSVAQVNYNRPLSIRFNQEVNLDKTIANLKINNTSANTETKFIAQYGTKTIKDKAGKSDEVEDKTVIQVYNKADRYDRGKMWDFNNSYEASITEAFPLAGDINLSGDLKINFTASDVLADLSVVSPRSTNVSTDLFDPQGQVNIFFHEDINLDKTKINSQYLTKIEYGKKCLETTAEYGYGFSCTQTEDKSHLIVSFDKDKAKVGEVLNLKFDKIVNVDGQTINHDEFTRTIAIYRPLEVASQNLYQADKVDPSTIYVCTNNPIAKMPGNELTRKQSAEYLQTDNEGQLVSWGASNMVPANPSNYWHCPSGRFETAYNWALMPGTNYKLQLKVIDDFGQVAQLKLDFKTGELPKSSLNFFHYQASNQGYNVTTPTKTELTYAVVNMDYVDINFCQLSAERMLYYLNDRPSYVNGSEAVTGCLKTVNKKLTLANRYWLKNYFKINLKDYVGAGTGHWIITFTHPDYVEAYGENPRQIHERTYVTVTNLSLVGKWVDVDQDFNQDKLKNIYWVTRLNDLSPVAGATVKLWSGNHNAGAGSAKTDSSGLAQIDASSELSGATVEAGSDSALLMNQWDSKLSSGGTAYNNNFVYLYTDRPIYRPGQTVYFKAIWRTGYDGKYDFIADKNITVTAKGPDDKIYDKELKLSPFGTVNGEFIIPADAALGGYNIQTDNGGYYNFDVEEYVPAGFKIDAKTDKSEYMSGEAINLDLSASYYFGAPLEGGTVEYSLGSQNYYFDRYQDEYFSFGNSWYYCPDCGYGDRFVLRGKAQLDNKGKVRISQAFDIDKLFKDDEKSSKLVNFYYTITNPNGQQISGSESIILHAGQYYVGLNSSKDFVGKQEKFQLKAKTVDINGKPMGVNKLKLIVNRINWVENKRQEVDGGYYYDSERQLEAVSEQVINTDSKGNWTGDMALDKEGEYEINLIGTDDAERKIKVNYSLYVYGDAQVSVRQTNDQSLGLTTDKNSLRAGETGRILIKSPYKKAKALIAIERGKVYEYKIIDINQNLTQYEFPMKDNYAPQVYASVILISDKPDVKYGSVSFSVNTFKNDLKVSVKADKDHYLPGETVNLKITARDGGDAPVMAELSVAVADLSVLALSGNPKKNPGAFFYDYFPLNVSSGSNIKDLLQVADIPIGGSKGGDGTSDQGLDKKKRGEFKDTAFWSAQILTDGQGQASASFKLPDNLTTWQIESLGLTKDLKVGVDYQEFIARKDLMVVPLKPRFIVAGDEFMVGAKIVNQTDGLQTVQVGLASESLNLIEKDRTVKLTAGEISNVYFKVQAPMNIMSGVHKFTLVARAGNNEDTVESVVLITAPTTYETTATAGYSEATTMNEYLYLPDNPYKQFSQLKIASSATLAVYLNSALNYLASYPYGCGEQIASKLRALAVIKEGQNSGSEMANYKIEKIIGPDGLEYSLDKAIEIGLEKLLANYQSGSGFSYYPGGQANYYVTLAATKAMLELKTAKINIDKTILESSAQFIKDKILDEDPMRKIDNSGVIFGSQILMAVNDKLDDAVIRRIKPIAADKKYLVDQASNLEVIALADVVADAPVLKNSLAQDLEQLLDNRLEIDSRGSFLRPTSNWSWNYYEDDINDTAQYLSLIVKNKRTHPQNDNLWRWLMKSRAEDGAWGSTNNTMSVIKAMAAYLDWKQELKSDFKLDISINNQLKESRQYSAANILSQDLKTWYGQDLSAGTLNNISLTKTNNNSLTNGYYYDLAFRYYLPAETIGPRDEGFVVTRNFYSSEDEEMVTPVTSARVGDVLKARVEIMSGEDRHNVSVESFIPAGFELVNFNLATENSALKEQYNDEQYNDSYDYSGGGYVAPGDDQQAVNIRPEKAELRDDRVFLFKEDLSPGSYYYDYYVRALVPGKFNHLPAVAQEMYFPENFGRTGGGYFEVKAQ